MIWFCLVIEAHFMKSFVAFWGASTESLSVILFSFLLTRLDFESITSGDIHEFREELARLVKRKIEGESLQATTLPK